MIQACRNSIIRLFTLSMGQRTEELIHSVSTNVSDVMATNSANVYNRYDEEKTERKQVKSKIYPPKYTQEKQYKYINFPSIIPKTFRLPGVILRISLPGMP